MQQIKTVLALGMFLLAGCAFQPIVWTDSSNIPQNKGVAFVKISLEGRDSANIFIDNGGARAYSKLTVKRGENIYAMILDEGVYTFRTLLYNHETVLPITAEKVRPLISENSKERGSEFYCSSWMVKSNNLSIIGKIQFNVVENDNFYLKCDEQDSTRLTIEGEARKNFPKTFQFYQE